MKQKAILFEWSFFLTFTDMQLLKRYFNTMKRISILFLVLISTLIDAQAQVEGDRVVDTEKHQVVMQVTQADSLYQRAVISQLKNIRQALPNAEIEVVCHSQGLPMLVAGQSLMANQIAALSQQGVTFAACENTMRRHGIEPQGLLPSATTVPSGMAEIILKQTQGWTYVKGGL